MESIASTRRVASRVWLEGMASAAVCPCAEAQRRIGTGISHGCGRPSCAETQRGNGTGLAWVRASVLRESAAGQWYRSRMGAGVYPCAESLRGSGTGISHGHKYPSLRESAVAQRYRHFAWVRTSTLARRRSGAMVLASRMGASVRPCAEALWGSGTVISHGCERPSCAKAQRRNGTGISHGCERPSCAETQRGNGTGISHGCERPLLRGGAAGQWHRHLTWVRAFVLRESAAAQWSRHFARVRTSTPCAEAPHPRPLPPPAMRLKRRGYPVA